MMHMQPFGLGLTGWRCVSLIGQPLSYVVEYRVSHYHADKMSICCTIEERENNELSAFYDVYIGCFIW